MTMPPQASPLLQSLIRSKQYDLALQLLSSLPPSLAASQLGFRDNLGQTFLHHVLKGGGGSSASSNSHSSLHGLLFLLSILAPSLHSLPDSNGWLPLHHCAYSGACIFCLRFAARHCSPLTGGPGLSVPTKYSQRTPLQLQAMYNRGPASGPLRRFLQAATMNERLRYTLLLCVKRLFEGCESQAAAERRRPSSRAGVGVPDHRPLNDSALVNDEECGEGAAARAGGPLAPFARSLLDSGRGNELGREVFAAAVLDRMITSGWGERAWWIVTCIGVREDADDGGKDGGGGDGTGRDSDGTT